MIQTIYRRQQAFVFYFGVGIFLTGAILLIFPGNDPTLVQAGVPSLLRILDHVGYVLGGLLLAIGISRAVPRLEAAGHILISALFLVVAWITVRQATTLPDAVGALGFILPLSIGSAFRAYILLSDDGH